jgi:hypothetical protein
MKTRLDQDTTYTAFMSDNNSLMTNNNLHSIQLTVLIPSNIVLCQVETWHNFFAKTIKLFNLNMVNSVNS